MFWLWISAALVACAPSEQVPEDVRGAEAVPADAAVAPQEPDGGSRGPRVVFLGTSLTAGLGLLRQEETYVSQLDAMADSVGIPMDAVNAGVSGDTSAGGLRRLEWLLRDPMDILVVELGANDGLRGQDPDATSANLREIVTRVRDRNPEARVFVAAMEAPPNLGDSYTARFRDIFPTVARDTGAQLIPFFLDGVAGVPDLNQADGMHPTPEGHRRMAENMWSSLEPALRGWWTSHPDARSGS